MLTSPIPLAGLGIALVLALIAPATTLVAPAAPFADRPVAFVGLPRVSPTGPSAECDEATDPLCQIEDDRPGRPVGDDAGGRPKGSGCTWDGRTVPCVDPSYGSYVGDGCYWKPLSPQPDGLKPPSGEDSSNGKWGVQSCYTSPDSDVVRQSYRWMIDGQVGPTPEELARRALAKLRLRGARIGIVPHPSGSGAVGLPVWMWTEVTPQTWGPQQASESSGGLTVTLTARAYQIVWTMGDGGSVACGSPGTPYLPRYGNSPSPSCGYRYDRPSATPAAPNGRYPVTATTYWRVVWSGGGQSGVLSPTSRSRASVRIGEIPVVGR